MNGMAAAAAHHRRKRVRLQRLLAAAAGACAEQEEPTPVYYCYYYYYASWKCNRGEKIMIKRNIRNLRKTGLWFLRVVLVVVVVHHAIAPVLKCVHGN